MTLRIELNSYTGPIKKTVLVITNDPQNRGVLLVLQRD